MNSSAGAMIPFIIVLVLVTLAIVIIISYVNKMRGLRAQLSALRRNVPGSAPEADYSWFYYINPRSRNRQITGIGVYTSIPFDFRFERRDSFDRLAATFGFANPVLTGDPEFDDRIYAYSTNPFFYQVLGSNAGLRKTILDIFQSGLTSVFYEKGQIVACGGSGSAMSGRFRADNEPAREIAAKLHECIHSAAAIQLNPGDTSFQRAAALDKSMKMIFGFFCIIGLIGAFTCGAGVIHQLTSLIPLFRLSAICSIGFTIAMLVLLRALMSGTPYGADTFRGFMQFGIAAIMGLSFTGLYIADITLDKNEPVAHWQRVANKYFTTGKHNSHSYYLTVDGWNDAKPVDIHISLPIYNAINPGQRFHFFSHPGYFNIEWISLQ